MKMKTAATTTAGAVVAATGVLGFSPSAEAALGPTVYSITSQCKGSIIEQGHFRGGRDGQVSAGKWQLWYSPNNGGTNCIVTYDNMSGRHEMSATLAVKNRGSKTDWGYFDTFAGGVQGTNTNGSCVMISGHVLVSYYSLGTMVNDKGTTMSNRWIHCG